MADYAPLSDLDQPIPDASLAALRSRYEPTTRIRVTPAWEPQKEGVGPSAGTLTEDLSRKSPLPDVSGLSLGDIVKQYGQPIWDQRQEQRQEQPQQALAKPQEEPQDEVTAEQARAAQLAADEQSAAEDAREAAAVRMYRGQAGPHRQLGGPPDLDPAATATAAQGFVPGAGIADVMGLLPDWKGGFQPSFGQNVSQGNYGTAAMQTMGAAGDLLYGAGALAPLGVMAKSPRAMQLIKAGEELTPEAKAALGLNNPAVHPEITGPEHAQAYMRDRYGDIGTHPDEKNLTVNNILDQPGLEVKARSRRVKNIARGLEDGGSLALRQLGVPLGKIEESHPLHDEMISRAIAAEIRGAMSRGGKTAADWYTKAVQEAMDHASKIWPEIKSDPHQRMALTAALAITSQGEVVQSNVRLAEKAYEHFRKTGHFPTNLPAKEQESINGNFNKLNNLLDTLGPEGTREFLGKEFTVKQLADMGHEVGGENMGSRVYGSAIFGPKIGQGFYQNLNGNYNPVTMDLWFMRAWGRLTGTLVGGDLTKPLARFTNAIRAEGKSVPRDPERLKQLAEDIISKHEADYRKNAALYKSGEKKKSELTYSADRYLHNLEGINETPSGGGQRNWIRDRINRAREILKSQGHDLTNADLQAIWWYPEKDLYSKLGGRPSEAINTDYAAAFKDLAERRAAERSRSR
jgi:hypothetical protein